VDGDELSRLRSHLAATGLRGLEGLQGTHRG
jgi:hypothetical protein